MFALSPQPAVTSFAVPGLSEIGIQQGLPQTNDFGGKAAAGIPNAATRGIPPVIWMVIFLVVGYLILRMLLE